MKAEGYIATRHTAQDYSPRALGRARPLTVGSATGAHRTVLVLLRRGGLPRLDPCLCSPP